MTLKQFAVKYSRAIKLSEGGAVKYSADHVPLMLAQLDGNHQYQTGHHNEDAATFRGVLADLLDENGLPGAEHLRMRHRPVLVHEGREVRPAYYNSGRLERQARDVSLLTHAAIARGPFDHYNLPHSLLGFRATQDESRPFFESGEMTNGTETRHVAELPDLLANHYTELLNRSESEHGHHPFIDTVRPIIEQLRATPAAFHDVFARPDGTRGEL